ncbi:MAG TPA: 3'(2'),5'-bisphosphate nucleotidase CysQ [Streptosporangiaceae bacterium]|nr:3'(2'),5'-bisphosphate nucleotidase CysQ [Streptosporangiaceae bacterium]
MTSDDHQLAAELAEAAGDRLLDLRRGGGDPAELRKAGDRLSHEFLMAELAAHRPDDAVLSEEGVDNPVRLSAARVWIVDPLDGTREFGEEGRTDWAVHVALWEAGPAGEEGRLTAGSVALPAQGLVLSTVKPPQAAGAAGDGRPLRVVVSRTRPPAFLERMSELMDITLVPMGSAGAKACEVIKGEADAYIHGGGQYEWDSAAPVAVAQAAGLHASRIDGSGLRYNQHNPVLPDILICTAPLAGLLVDAISAAGRPGGQ